MKPLNLFYPMILASLLTSVLARAGADDVNTRSELAQFLSDNRPKLGLFEDGAKIQSIELKSGYFENPTYRIQTSRCAVLVTFSKNSAYSIKSLTCAGEDFNADFAKALANAEDVEKFGQAIAAAFEAKVIDRDDILSVSMDRLETLVDSRKIPKENLIPYLDQILTRYFIAGYQVSGGFVTNGELSPLERAILYAKPYFLTAKLFRIKAALGLSE